MKLYQALFNKLTGTVGITAISSSRVYPMVIPEGASLPAITYHEISNPAIHASVSDPNISKPRYQVSCWSTSYLQSQQLAYQVKVALQDFTGTFGGVGGVEVQRIFYEDGIEMIEIDPEKKETTYHRAQDFIIWHSSS